MMLLSLYWWRQRVRWVFQPVVTIQPLDELGLPFGEPYRAPKHVLYGKAYNHSSVIDANDFCVSIISGPDFTQLDADPEITSLTGDDTPLNVTTQDQGWDTAKLDAKKSKCLGVNAALTTDSFLLSSQFWEMIVELGGQARPGFTSTQGTFVPKK